MKNYFHDHVSVQDLIRKVQENEQEISQLRRYLTDCSVKVSRARHGRSVLGFYVPYFCGSLGFISG